MGLLYQPVTKNLQKNVNREIRKVKRTVDRQLPEFQFCLDNGTSNDIVKEAKHLESFLCAKLDPWKDQIENAIQDCKDLQDTLQEQASGDPLLYDTIETQYDRLSKEIVELYKLEAKRDSTLQYVIYCCERYYNKEDK